MALPSVGTRVTYPAGDLIARARVLHVEPVATDDGERLAVLLDTTSIHPVDAGWPDQPADAGVITVIDGAALTVLDAIVAATDGETLHLGRDIPVRKGTEGWAFVVAHLVDAGSAIAEGDEVETRADALLRASLSRGHTACHLASLALNRALADRWTKDPRRDPLGSPDFDAAAIASSRIEPNGSVDRYRLNKSLRRAGFDATVFTGEYGADELRAAEASIDDTLATWIAGGGDIRIERDGDLLTDRRQWAADLEGGTARLFCGGTHATSLADLGDVRVRLELVDDDGTPTLVMTTRAHAPS
ncbi:metal-dependent hydrolase [Agromyces protaetiae]|uniref:Metal-dependent hydrolase n=1 Tax=Agromyces protaetiae TaxID=2509455 RepID=A0A4V0YH38_9MICO|nr:metal-dependent hydrolase [Agromyces protaetiae]QAY73361.1 metal-dependent hydrolase [Agromyces protaetiae]